VGERDALYAENRGAARSSAHDRNGCFESVAASTEEMFGQRYFWVKLNGHDDASLPRASQRTD
jgi:hypothetical protein